MQHPPPDITSYLSRHRPICTVLDELRDNLINYYSFEGGPGTETHNNALALVAEAKDYAQRMSNRLMEYKRKGQEPSPPPSGDMVLVPREPTEAMIEAAEQIEARVYESGKVANGNAIYNAMIAASPAPPTHEAVKP